MERVMGNILLFNKEWTFLLTELETTLKQVTERVSEFKEVDIPHDWLIYDTHNLYKSGCGWYRKAFNIGESYRQDKQYIVRFDGVYMDTTVYVNGAKIGEWKYGYSTFDMNITEALHSGDNEIIVQVCHQAPNSRWYSGAGMYRNVWLKECEDVYLPLDGTYVATSACEGGFSIEIETEVAGAITESTQCHYSLWKDKEMVQDFGIQQVVAHQTSEAKVVTTAVVTNPELWDIDSPNCYQLCVKLYNNGDALKDIQYITVGFRTMEFDSDRGFFLNGKNIKINGVCEHHDLGCLGAAFSKEAMRRKFNLLRGMGVNGIRTSHNMPAPEVMELADEMGFLIVSEAFDMWEMSKTEFDYARFFVEWAGRDVESWVRRDRNHPSLLLWSIGNEIYDTHAGAHGQEITRRLVDFVRQHDTKENAQITIGSNFMPWEPAQKCADIVKMAGYNYAEKYYEQHHKEHPDWVIYGSETASIVQSRGVYHFPLSQSTLAEEDLQCSALGNSTTSWGAKSVETCISVDRDMPFSFGQFLWTGFDYIGEPTPYHTKNSYFGHLDTAGFPKDSYYVFQAEWGGSKNKPMVHLFPYWDFNEGQLIDVRACTNCASVELFVNGVSQGKQEIEHNKGSKLLGDWQVKYTSGTIKVVAYDEEGNAVAEESKTSFGDGVKITLQAEREILRADGEDLCFVIIGVVDAEGHGVENAMNYVTVSVDGPGRLLGLDNGDSADYDQYKGNCRKLFNGKLLAVVGTTQEAGIITIRVEGAGLEGASLIVNAEKAPIRKGICCSENWSKGKIDLLELNQNIPVRKIDLKAPKGQLLTPESNTVTMEATIYPENASDTDVIWAVVNDAGIEIPYANFEKMETKGNSHKVKITAWGDGQFRVRCMTKSGTDDVKLISQLELTAQGFGQVMLNPYGFISAGLFTDSIGDLSNGNEKGIATGRDDACGAVYSNIDFGEYGSDEITLPIFTLNDEAYHIEVWEGKPLENDSKFITTLIYQKPSIWNVYQEETYKLPRRIKGVTTIGFLLHSKIHLKGFSFTKYEKAISPLLAAECNKVYGDSFVVEKEAVTGIGNNVALEFWDMDFGEKGANQITITGHTPLAVNTIHIRFTPEEGESVHSIAEFTRTTGYEEQHFNIEPLKGKGKVEFVFLPGSSFDFKSFQFQG